ncbi:hypothetical protein HHI36_008706 [Cryptolaemus montrouzieri]|uniref:Uncharacterized protein n=1 Tax=Cryptolaemus montrouzieri TaxID=559131 RepID=A0ABD2MT65_9CUCU
MLSRYINSFDNLTFCFDSMADDGKGDSVPKKHLHEDASDSAKQNTVPWNGSDCMRLRYHSGTKSLICPDQIPHIKHIFLTIVQQRSTLRIHILSLRKSLGTSLIIVKRWRY